MSELISLKQATITTGLRDLGEFTVESNAMRFSDPCYANDVWCKGSMPALNGKWQARLGFFRDSYDARNLANHINQLKYLLTCYQNFKNFEEKSLWESFSRIVSQARDHKNGFQKISRLYELIEEQTDEVKKAAFKKLADEAVAYFDPLYTNKEDQYWERDLWLLFELASAFQSFHQYIGFDESLFELRLEKLRLLKEKEDGGVFSQEDEEQYFKKSIARSIEKIENKIDKAQKAYDSGAPRRVQFLHIKHESIPEFTSFEQEAWIDHQGFDVGVDSGQAGFFDEAWYAEVHNGDHHYDMLCDLTLGQYRIDPETGERAEYNYAGTFEFGCNGQTAHGDGSAPLYYRTDADGNVIEAAYHYDITYEEDEDEELEETSDSEG